MLLRVRHFRLIGVSSQLMEPCYVTLFTLILRKQSDVTLFSFTPFHHCVSTDFPPFSTCWEVFPGQHTHTTKPHYTEPVEHSLHPSYSFFLFYFFYFQALKQDNNHVAVKETIPTALLFFTEVSLAVMHYQMWYSIPLLLLLESFKRITSLDTHSFEIFALYLSQIRDKNRLKD